MKRKQPTLLQIQKIQKKSVENALPDRGTPAGGLPGF